MPTEMPHSQRRNGIFRCRDRGFALVVTLALMILLTVVAVGLLTLSSVSLRSSNQSQAQATARANARLALALAIGELQKQTGTDTRVTARADILKPENPPVLGVWKSWQGDDHTTTGTYAGRPVSPGDYPAAKKARFLTWLVSGNSAVPANSDTVPNTSAGTGKIPLVGPGSAAPDTATTKLRVNLTPTSLSSGKETGSYAWWVSGENQKARLPKPYKISNNTVGSWAPQIKSHTVADPSVFRMNSLLADATPANKAISLRQGDLIATSGTLPMSKEFFHDLSATSVGLLTNTATGGWRKDLSLLTENWDLEPKSNQPFFRVKPGEDIAFNIPEIGNYRPNKSLFYPWAAYRRGDFGNYPSDQNGAVTSWENLKHWATLYKQMKFVGTAIDPFAADFDGQGFPNCFDYLHKTRIVPLIARIQWVFSHYATKDTATPPNYTPRLLITPIITLWNPYNVSIEPANVINFRLLRCTPEAFRFQVGAVQNTNWNSILQSNNWRDLPRTYSLNSTDNLAAPLAGMNFNINLTNPINPIKPGETLIFSPAATPVPFSANITLTPGARLTGGFHVPIKKDDGTQFAALPGSTPVKPEARFDAHSHDGTVYDIKWEGVGIIMDENDNGKKMLAYRYQVYPDVARAVFVLPPNTALTPATLAQSELSPQPFMTTVFGARTASQTFFPAKGFVQSSPFVNITTMGGARTSVNWQPQLQYPGTAHPVNSPFDFSFRAIAPFDSLLPNADAASRGFIVSGFQSADGLSRCIINELPTQPIQSLAELQNWNLRSDNPIPPFCFNIVGNSDATPLIPANTVFNNPPPGPQAGQELQHDDFYCANHLLFDDWFVSSIAPKSTNLGVPASTLTSKKTFTDFVKGTDPLRNSAYLPIKVDTAAAQTTTGADKLFTDHASKAGAWKTIASRIEVEGMFNVNSTSVKAWRALLGHARNQRIPYVTTTGSAVSGAQDYVNSRFSVAGDVEARSTSPAPTSGQFSAAAEFTGYRKLTSAILDRFAQEIVNEVRARGPFLSLSEFVNRQLSSGNLALAGTIQAALNTLAADSLINPYSVIQSRSTKVDLVNLPFAASSGYNFAAAAEGYSAYGLPGWTRQADVLRPIAPILSARDDTFTIRAYGDARDNSNNITSRATCEAVVRRTRDFVDPADAPEITTLPTSAANLIFGRRYEIISFRWLSDSEI